MRRLVLFLATATCGFAQVGGLTELPTPETRASICVNSSFENGSGSPDNWALGGGGLSWTTDDARNRSYCIASRAVRITHRHLQRALEFHYPAGLGKSLLDRNPAHQHGNSSDAHRREMRPSPENPW